MQLPVAEPSRRFLVAFFVLLGLAVVVNIAWEASLPASEAAIRRSDSEELIDVAQHDEPSLLTKVGFALSLRSVGRGGVLVVPPDSGIQASQVQHLAGMTMRVEEYDPTVNPSFIDEIDATRWIDGEGRIHFSSGTQNRYVILAMDSPASTLRVFVTAEGDVIVVDDRLLGGADG